MTSHTLRHAFVTHLLQNGAYIRTVQQQLGHVNVKTIEIYTQVLKQGAKGVISPLSHLLSEQCRINQCVQLDLSHFIYPPDKPQLHRF